MSVEVVFLEGWTEPDVYPDATSWETEDGAISVYDAEDLKLAEYPRGSYARVRLTSTPEGVVS